MCCHLGKRFKVHGSYSWSVFIIILKITHESQKDLAHVKTLLLSMHRSQLRLCSLYGNYNPAIKEELHLGGY